MCAHSLCLDVTGIISTYLDPNLKTSRFPPSLEEQVGALSLITKLAKITENAIADIFKDLQIAQIESKKTHFDQTAIRIAELVCSATNGNLQRVHALLNDPLIKVFDLKNKTYPWRQPRYIALQKAVEAASLHNQAETLRLILIHPTYTSLTRSAPTYIELTCWQRNHLNDPRVKAILQQNFEAVYLPDSAKTIFKAALKASHEADSSACQEVLSQLNPEDADRL
jgi:hypothetical protein